MASEVPEDYSKLALDVKLGHKVWRARLMGYEEAAKLFRRIDDESSPEYSKFTGQIKKFVIDSNQVAQEKGVEAALAFVECAAAAKKITKDVVGGVVTKCLSARAKTKESAIQVCLMFVEIEEQEAVLEALLEGLANKQPKIVAGSVQTITRIVQDFGARVLNIKVLMGKVPTLFEQSDKNIRAEAKTLAIELYKWIGAAIKPSLEKKLKPVQLKELEEEWGKISGGPGAPARMLRSQQAQPPAAVAGGGGGGGGEGGGGGAPDTGGVAADAAAVLDPYDLADPEDLLGKMPKDFYEKVADTKWKERKETLDTVLPLAQAMKLQPGEYGELVKALKKVITKDSNVMIVAVAGNVVTGLAKGLRANFRSYASVIITGIFEKFKEKKQNVVTSLREAADAVYLTTSLGQIQEEVIEGLANKNPSVKAEILLFLCRCFQQCVPSMLPKPMLKAFCPPLVQKLDDTNPAVRDAGMECLGTLLRVVGDRPLNAYLEKIDKTKMAKIQEHREAIELKIQTGVIPSPMKGQAARPPTPSAPSAAPSTSESVPSDQSEPPKKRKPAGPGAKKKAPPTAESESEKPSVKESPSTPPKKKPPSGTAKGGGAPGGGKGKGKQKGGGAKAGEAPDPPEPNIANEDVEEKAKGCLPAGLLDQLADAKWKERLEACEKFKEFVEGQAAGEMQSLLCCKVLARKPGWKDSNFQVMNAKFAVVSILAQKAKVFGRKSMACVMPALVEKLGDIKVKATSGETLRVIAERMTLNYVALQAMKHSFEQKSPKVHSESLEWLGQSVKDFGFLLDIKPFIDYIKKAFGATNPAVRTAAVSLLSVIYLYIGAQLRMFFEDEKPALLQQIDAAFEKVSGESAPAPTRGPNVGGDEEEEEEGTEEGGGAGGAAAAKPVSMADIMPKVDISGQIKPDLIKEMGDKNWKIRAETLQKVVDILKAAKFIEPHLGELPAGLKARLGDSNKNLVITTLNIVATLASSMGSNCSKHVKTLLPAVIVTFGDSKTHVRAAGVACLNAWHTEVGVVVMVEQDILTPALTTENPNLRTELLHWLEETLPSAGKLPSEFSTIVPPLFSCLEDRSGEVRKKAQAALPHIMAHVGYDNMCKQCSRLNPASKQVIKPLLDKAKPAKAPPPAAPAASKHAETSKTAASKAPPPAAEESLKKASKAAKVSEAEEEEEPDKAASNKKTATGKKGTAKGGAKSKGSKKGGAAEEEAGSLFVVVKNGKEGRMKDDEKMKVLKWNFGQPRREHVDQLKDQMHPCVNATVLAQLFHDDFKKHIAALETFTKCIRSAEGTTVTAIVGTTDLLLRWITLRFFDTNTTVNLKCLDFLKALFQLLVAQETYRMSDYEASGFLPYLVNKVGDAKDPVRKGVRGLFRDICSMYPPVKMFTFVLEGLKSKNARQRTECLEELGVLIQNNGMIVCGPQPQKTVPLMAAQISDRDNTVRSAALNTLVVVYNNMGEAVYKYTSQLSDKDVSLLEERIRRSGKKFPASGAAPQTTAQSAEKSQEAPADSKKQGGLRLKPSGGVAAKPVEGAGGTEPAAEPAAVPPASVEEPVISPSEPPPPEPPKAGTFPGPFKLNVDIPKMWSSVHARDDGGRGTKYKVDLSKEELALLDQSPVEMPRLFSKHLNPSFPVDLSPSRMASTSAAINYIISQIGSADHLTCCKAAKQIEATMLNSSQRAAINPHVEQLIGTILMQMRMTFTTPHASTGDKAALNQVQELGKRLTACLYTLFGEPSLAVLVSRDTLLEVERDVMGYLVDDQVLKLSEGTQMVRTLNSLMQRVCEHGEATAVFGSLLHLLLKSLTSDGRLTPLTELTMKCLWKLTKQVPQLLTRLDVDRLLLDVHLFMQSYLETYQAPSVDDTPFRTVKTVLFHLTKTLGPGVLDHMTLIEDSSTSKVLVYINRTLAKQHKGTEGVARTTSSAASSAPPLSIGATEGDKGRMKVETMSRMLHTVPPGSSGQFAEIFGKLTNPATTTEGFVALDRYMVEHPSFKLDAMLANQSTFYRSYIKQGLQALKKNAAERDAPKSDSDMQFEILRNMKQKSGAMFGVSKEELMSGVDHSNRNTATTDENKPVNTRQPPPAKSIPKLSSGLKVPSAGKAGVSGVPVDLADLRKRLNQLMK